MPIIFIILLAILIGQVGFWDAMGSVLGAFAMVALFFIVLIAAIVIGGLMLVRRFR
ncbi:hypothetical protein SAMN02983003_3522 [Devosia enhydra]|uniref:Uncharacterized protein n=1 Tax=Devosia enhydra TaxID=665118 RepID=A0A1K2I1T2_9HYPH|nr:hypothetical protein [Devosia enhydra]SFZ86342.1 hypothetical protein SAMN02983003_3522 [Devosia enhydra]